MRPAVKSNGWSMRNVFPPQRRFGQNCSGAAALAPSAGDEVLASGGGLALLGEGADGQNQLCRSSHSQLRGGDVAHHDPAFETAASVFFTEAADAIQGIRRGLLRGKNFPATE